MLIGGLERLLGVQEREKNEFPEFKDLLKALLAVHVRRLIYFVQVLCVYEGEDVNKLSNALFPSISTPHKLQST